MTASDALQRLYSLDASSPDFLRVLHGLIRYDEEERYSSSLEGEELVRLVDFLDDALGAIPTSDDIFRQCLRKLRAICGYHTTLPSSHIVYGDLARIGESPIFGGFADVWQGTHGGREVCIKALRISLNDDESLSKSFFKEAVVWKRLRHPNIVPFLGVTHKPLQIVSEWMPNGTLTHYVEKNPGADRIALLLDVAEGLNYLHMNCTIHGDLKGPNILVDHNGHACLTDFGLASIVHGVNSALVSRLEGHTTRWTAPEILMGANKITRNADIFSFGMVAIEVFTGRYPFSDLKSPLVMLKIVAGGRPVRPQGTQELGLVDSVWNMMVDCWQQDPARRPTISAVLGFLRECYTLRAANQPQSALAPWQAAGDTGNAKTHGVISLTPTDENSSPSQSPKSSEHSNKSFFQAHKTLATPGSTFNVVFPTTSQSSGGSSSDTQSNEHHRASNSAALGHDTLIPDVDKNIQPVDDQTHARGDIDIGLPQLVRPATFDETKPRPSKYRLFRTTSLPALKDPRPVLPTGSGSDGKKEKRSQKTARALWRGVAAVIRFKVFAKRKPMEDHGGG